MNVLRIFVLILINYFIIINCLKLISMHNLNTYLLVLKLHREKEITTATYICCSMFVNIETLRILLFSMLAYYFGDFYLLIYRAKQITAYMHIYTNAQKSPGFRLNRSVQRRTYNFFKYFFCFLLKLLNKRIKKQSQVSVDFTLHVTVWKFLFSF